MDDTQETLWTAYSLHVSQRTAISFKMYAVAAWHGLNVLKITLRCLGLIFVFLLYISKKQKKQPKMSHSSTSTKVFNVRGCVPFRLKENMAHRRVLTYSNISQIKIHPRSMLLVINKQNSGLHRYKALHTHLDFTKVWDHICSMSHSETRSFATVWFEWEHCS